MENSNQLTLVYLSAIAASFMGAAGSAYLMLVGADFSLAVSLSGFLPLEFSLWVDFYSVTFSLVVTIISSSVMVFSSFYMKSEKEQPRFLSLMSVFVLLMLILLFSGNLLTAMVGWDGLGLSSFLLVVYYESSASLGAGMLTSMVNRIGDMLFMVGLGLMSGSMSFDFKEKAELGADCLLASVILIGAMTKSAQIPFSAWLPAAMAAPTPVSALVHSSTLVTAGLFIIIRFNGGFGGGMLFVLALVGVVTCFMASSSAALESDVKKVVALSTLSQLGVMSAALGVGAVDLAFFHLVVHALFKALLFMCVGCVIISGYGGQEFRFFSGMYFKMPFVSMWLGVAVLSLSGVPFMSGFFSKDVIMEAFMANGVSLLGLLLLYSSCALTPYYSVRIMYNLMWFEGGAPFSSFSEESWEHQLCTSLLGFGSVLGGVALQKSVLHFNRPMVVSPMEKQAVMASCFVGVVMFFVLKIIMSEVVLFMTAFFGGMLFLAPLSGSPCAKCGLWVGMKSVEAEVTMMHLMGEGAASQVMERCSSFTATPTHWGVWVFLTHYALTAMAGAVSLIIYW